MPTLQIDGVGSVEVGPEFTRLTPDQQNATVSEIVASIRGGAAPAAAAPQPAPMAPRPAGEVLEPPAPPAPPPEPGLTAAAGRVAGRAGEAAAERFGDRPLGLSDQTIQELRASGALAAEGRAPTPIQLLNEVVYRFGAKAGDAILRSIGAGLGALGGAAEQTAVELGEDPGMAKRLGRDVPLLAEVAATVAGAPGAQSQAAAARGVAQTQRAAATEAAATRAAAPAAAATTAEEFKTAARPFYKQADDSGVVINQKSFKNLSDDIFSTAARKGLDPTLTPDSMAAIKRIQELADPATGPISFQSLDIARQIASDAKGAVKASDRRVAGIVTEKLDDYIARLSSKDVIAGDARTAAEVIVKGRDLWSRAGKLETIEDLITRASDSAGGFTASGIENALRTEFRALSKNKKQMRTFTAAEQAAIRRVSRGGTTLRNIGKLAPNTPFSGAVTGGLGAAAGTALGVGPLAGAAAAYGIGTGARALATALIKRRITSLQKIIREGGESAAASSAIGRGNALIAQLAGKAAPVVAGQAGSPSRGETKMGQEGALGETLSMAMAAIPGARRVAGASRKLSGMSVAEIDAKLAETLKGTDWHVMDVAGRKPAQLQAIKDQLPPGAMELAAAREVALQAEKKAVGMIDKELKGLLKGTDIDVMDVALRGVDGLKKLAHLIPERSLPRILELAAQRAKLVE